jgi:putative DNA primase/helicase
MESGCKSPIDAYNEAYGLELVLAGHGYTQRGRRWLSPNSETGSPGVTITDDGKKWMSTHGSDSAIGNPTKNGTMGDAFDLFTQYEHGGDRNAAIKAASKMFGLHHEYAHDVASEIPPQEEPPQNMGDDRIQETERESDGDGWPEPVDLPDKLPREEDFNFDFLPDKIQPWAKDITERMQCPPDYVGVTIMVALGTAIGRRIGVRPQAYTDWTVAPNLWGVLVGRPGLLKSPAMEAALSPLKALSAAAAERYQAEVVDFEVSKLAEKLRKDAAEKAARKKLIDDPGADISSLLTIEKADPPVQKRYIANDTTAAALGELHRLNPNGLMVFRDELVSLLKMLDRDENSEARGFYLTGWNGHSSYTFDRITRGMNLYIPAVCLSVLGSTQPARIAQYVDAAVNGTSGDEGLIQRFGMVVWPDASHSWKDVDRQPDSASKYQAHQIFEQLDKLNPYDIGAETDTDFSGNPSGLPYLRFDPGGLQLFQDWRANLEKIIRSGELRPVMESHLSKYRKLIPSLALVVHLASGVKGPVSESATIRALAWGQYLQSHAERLYASGTTPEAATARMIIAKIRNGKLSAPFTAREVHRPRWSGLTDISKVRSGIKLLVDHDWLSEAAQDQSGGGRPTVKYHLNPRVEA